MSGGHRFGQSKIKQHSVGETQRRRKQKRNGDAPLAKDAANRRPENKTETKGCSQQAHSLCPIFFSSDVGNISLRSGNVTAGDAVEDAANEKHPKSCRKD